MRLLIKQCRHCRRDKKTCEYANIIRAALKPIKGTGTLSHNCTLYPTLIPVVERYDGDGAQKTVEQIIHEGREIGARVRVHLKEVYCFEVGGNCDGPPEPYWKWADVETALGTVVTRPYVGKNWFVILLDKPVTLNVPSSGESWDKAREQSVEVRALAANKLEFVTEE